jgi:hypothetical protein
MIGAFLDSYGIIPNPRRCLWVIRVACPGWYYRSALAFMVRKRTADPDFLGIPGGKSQCDDTGKLFQV